MRWMPSPCSWLTRPKIEEQIWRSAQLGYGKRSSPVPRPSTCPILQHWHVWHWVSPLAVWRGISPWWTIAKAASAIGWDQKSSMASTGSSAAATSLNNSHKTRKRRGLSMTHNYPLRLDFTRVCCLILYNCFFNAALQNPPLHCCLDMHRSAAITWLGMRSVSCWFAHLFGLQIVHGRFCLTIPFDVC